VEDRTPGRTFPQQIKKHKDKHKEKRKNEKDHIRLNLINGTDSLQGALGSGI
jgi:hypothetical protein